MRKARLDWSDACGADLSWAEAGGMKAQGLIVDNSTVLWNIKPDNETVFDGVALDTARIDAKTRAQLQYIIRRLGWKEWCKQSFWRRWVLRPFVWSFWQFSDYGRSTLQIVLSFCLIVLAFGLLYCLCPELVAGLEENAPTWYWNLDRAVYLSIVTMTTLGSGDMFANPNCSCSYLVISLQVILGYVLLGALITRFAVMFTGTYQPEPPLKSPGERS
jgi:hypothetical protein